MKLLVTGAEGQLGREWKRTLNGAGSEFEACGRSQLDITDRRALSAYLDRSAPDVVVNCAAWTDVEGAEKDPEGAFRVNRDAVSDLARWCHGSGSLLVHFSTDYLFSGSREEQLRYPDGYPESAEPSPLNRYGESKLAGEVAITSSGCRHLILRLSWLCGAHGHNFVRTMLRLGRERPQLDVVSDQHSSPTWADTVPGVTLQLLKRGEAGIFHHTSAGLASWYDLAVETFRLAGMQVRVNPVASSDYPSDVARPLFSKLDTSRLRRVLKLEPEPWKEGLERMLRELGEQTGSDR